MAFEVVSMRVSFLKCKQLCGRDMCTDTDTDTLGRVEGSGLRYRYTSKQPQHMNGHGKHAKSRVFAHQLSQAQTANSTIKYGNETPAPTCLIYLRGYP